MLDSAAAAVGSDEDDHVCGGSNTTKNLLLPMLLATDARIPDDTMERTSTESHRPVSYVTANRCKTKCIYIIVSVSDEAQRYSSFVLGREETIVSTK